jgi:acylphosphatase
VKIRRVHVIVHGIVQGVFFRDYTRREAWALGVNGWVRNRRDGTVEAVIEGEEDKVAAMIDWLHAGSPHSVVESLDISDEEPRNEKGFDIRY